MDFGVSFEQQKRCDTIFEEASARWGQGPVGTDDPDATRAAFREAGRLGLTGLCLPRDVGGGGLGALDTALCLQAFGRGCADLGLAFAVAAHLLACAVPVRDFGSEKARGELLAGLASGELIASNAMTEDEAGSDVGALRTAARRAGSGFVLDGRKSWASNAPVADVVVTYAVTDPDAGFLGMSAFGLPSRRPGLVLGSPLPKMGLTGCLAGQVHFEECAVPEEYLLGEEGQGSAVFQHSMAWERACLFGIYLGMMERQLGQVVEHVSQRRQFGHRLGEFQGVSHKVAVMRQRLESAQLLLYRACWLMDEGRDPVAAVALSKVAVSEAAVHNSTDAVQLFGGRGYLAGGAEEQLRDSVPSTLFSGTTEIQRELIAKDLGL
ncbi:acyl-CoA dehydrogenase family protein [Streptomyces sp. P17]|uniref:acyl-CoA dehydrogenase family protein n=1 Tax=Streptomyces sp. P17 TaxID=3074716 RepID=UPI0028F45E52|nr:acyl-CoA dehydrogenase family protein [Streptomyces sp. P17]MDT9701308.1 acyl-CoA dehydrogenase family protein [Streptomyces sp. P17]